MDLDNAEPIHYISDSQISAAQPCYAKRSYVELCPAMRSDAMRSEAQQSPFLRNRIIK